VEEDTGSTDRPNHAETTASVSHSADTASLVAELAHLGSLKSHHKVHLYPFEQFCSCHFD
jgi:hypothetical protein